MSVHCCPDQLHTEHGGYACLPFTKAEGRGVRECLSAGTRETTGLCCRMLYKFIKENQRIQETQANQSTGAQSSSLYCPFWQCNEHPPFYRTKPNLTNAPSAQFNLRHARIPAHLEEMSRVTELE